MVKQSQTLNLKQAQQLVLTPQMQQSLKILQLSSLDLETYLEEELEKNPLLEKESEEINETEQSQDGENNPEISEAQEENIDEKPEKELPEKDSFEKDSFENLSSEKFQQNEALDTEDYRAGESDEDFTAKDYGDSDYIKTSNYENSDNDAGSIIEKNYSGEKTLKEHLLEQINLDFTENAEKIIASYLLEMLDGKGYLASENLDKEIEIIAKKLDCAVSEINQVIQKLQKLDPPGVFARNLEECLRIQLKENNRLDPLIEVLLSNLPLLAKGEVQKLKKLCNVSDEELSEMIDEIKSLNPRPASSFSEELPATKIPDLYLVKNSGVWSVELNQDIMPKLRVKSDYYKKVKSGKIKEEHKEYLNQNLSTANFIIRAISQRYDSILKVSQAIVDFQTEFFDKGINYLKPLTMKQIADKVELHESTVGRVVANKYIATPRGVLELKYFFTNALTSNYSENDISTQTAKNLIKELIEKETDVLSDDDIAKSLNDKGINIARRTVAKYREALHIPTSADRKRAKRVRLLG